VRCGCEGDAPILTLKKEFRLCNRARGSGYGRGYYLVEPRAWKRPVPINRQNRAGLGKGGVQCEHAGNKRSVLGRRGKEKTKVWGKTGEARGSPSCVKHSWVIAEFSRSEGGRRWWILGR